MFNSKTWPKKNKKNKSKTKKIMKKLLSLLVFLILIAQVQAQLPRVIILATGGTIAEQVHLLTGPVIQPEKFLLMI